MSPCVVTLGRHGDVLNGLGIARELFRRTGHAPGFLVGEEFAPTLEGASYVKPILWSGNYADLAPAVARIRAAGWSPVVAQVYGGPSYSRHTCDSYQREAWKVAGMVEAFGTAPLDLDRRDYEREEELLKKVLPESKPFILVCASGVSSPVPKLTNLPARLREHFPDHAVINLAEVQAYRVFDLLGLMDRAALLVSVDTVHLHLARAARCPVIAVLNDGWRGSIPPPTTVASFRYASVSTEQVTRAACSILTKEMRRVILAVNLFGKTDRHKRARTSRALIEQSPQVEAFYTSTYSRTARGLGDEKPLPYLADILAPAYTEANDEDVIVWTNDDIRLDPRIIEWASEHVGLYGAATMRRDEPGHCGRELFAFTKAWLRDNPLPDYLIGTHQFDLGIACLIRHRRGISSTLANIAEDFHPCDAAERYALHEPHPNEWPERTETPSGHHNARLFAEWLAHHGMDFWR